MPEEIRPPSAEELEAADRELNTGLPIELVNVHARAVMHGITPAQYVIRVLRERRIADQEAERPERDRRIAELVKAGHYHDATGHEDTLCQCPSPGTYAPAAGQRPPPERGSEKERKVRLFKEGSNGT